MNEVRNTMILASAGSGKTHALTVRFISLLAGGAKPERIVALTFTRKAAGEFFDEILKRLAEAAGADASARRLAGMLQRPELGVTDFRRMLRAMVDAMPRLRLETLDGFMGAVARAFALELGMSGDFEVLEAYGADLARRRVLQQMFARAGELSAAQKEFIEGFKRATFGHESKSLGPQLEEYIKHNQELYLEAPEAERWGSEKNIWPGGCPWLSPTPPSADILRRLREEVAALSMADDQRVFWGKFIAELEEWVPGTTISDSLKRTLGKLLDVWPELATGRAVVVVARKKQELSQGLGAALTTALCWKIGGELRQKMERTSGIHAVLAGYEECYHQMVRRTGRLTFSDVLRLLLPRVEGPVLTQRETEEGRLFIDYRLDAGIDHWLLDEFQDTSRAQWSVLQNLIDEVVQDESGERSFFCVGDVKQSIYGWRQGDPRLFREILARYNAVEETVVLKHLNESWRSGPPVIAMVNAVFGNASVWLELFPQAMAEQWNREWRQHQTAKSDRVGQAAWLHGTDKEGCWDVALQILRQIQPWTRGLSCAVLVRKNKVAAELADFLRREGQVPAVAEADLHVVTDNPIGAALLALVQAAAHPGDSLAWEHCQMSPLGRLLLEDGLVSQEQISRFVLGQIAAEGFERTLDFWGAKLVAAGAAEGAFAQLRLQQILEAARQFDANAGSRDPGEFRSYMERFTVRDSEGTGIVRVMTVHKSKGLGFDVVILPDLEGKKLDESRNSRVVANRKTDGRVSWVMDMPGTAIGRADPELSAYMEKAEADRGYEQISLYYVAMTRAKYGLYAISVPVGKSKSHNFPKVLTETLGDKSAEVSVGGIRLEGGWGEGDSHWFEKHKQTFESAAAAGPAGLCLDEARRRPRFVARQPAKGESFRIGMSSVFSLEQAPGRQFGTSIHAVLASIEWLDRVDPSKWVAPFAVTTEVRAEVEGCLRDEQLAEIWKRPSDGRAEVWRERPFDVLLNEHWVSGVVDRVVTIRDGSGNAVRAVVYDFKTEKVDSAQLVVAAARHLEQLSVYRRAVAILLGLNFDRVRAELVFTKLRHRVPLPVSVV